MRSISQALIVVFALGVFAGVGGGMGQLVANMQAATCTSTPQACQ